MIAVDYPVILGTIPNLDAINDIIDDEAEYFEKYYEEYSGRKLYGIFRRLCDIYG